MVLGGSIYSFNSPVSGSKERYKENYGAMHVSASDTAITFEFISLTGAIIDSYTIDDGSSSTNGGLSRFSGCTTNNNASVD